MRTANPINVVMVRLVAERLGQACDSVVFMGGAVVDLLITDPAAAPVRPTRDVDLIVEVATLHDYYEFSNLLRSRGFTEYSSQADGPICRWVVDDIKVDAMPMDEQALGFSNRYYQAAVETAKSFNISENLGIRLISAPCFLATKIEAFQGRGQSDFMASPDMEDIIAVVDGRLEIIDEIIDSPGVVRNFLIKKFSMLLQNEDFLESLPGHIEYEGFNSQRVPILLERIRTIALMELGDS